MQILSAFLSHKSEDKELVTAVARELGRRGIRAWLDTQELVAGADLRPCFRKAVSEQNVVVIFLSHAALQSSWVRDELDIALELEREVGRERIIPVFLGDAIELVRSYGPIARQWMDPEHTRVERLGIIQIDADGSPRPASGLAGKIAEAIYARAETRTRGELAVLIDQRGSGYKRELPTVPAELAASDMAALLFRPDLEERTTRATVPISEWPAFARTMMEALGRAIDLSPMRRQRIHIVPSCQMAIAALVGWTIERSSEKELVLHGRQGHTIELPLGELQPPSGGTSTASESAKSGEPAAVVIANEDHDRIDDALLDARQRQWPPAMVRAPRAVTTTADLEQVARDAVATVKEFRRRGVRRIVIYNLSAALLLAAVTAQLMHVCDNVSIAEWVSSREDYEIDPLPPRA